MTTSSTSTEQIASYRSLFWDNAIHAFGTSYVFQQRARRLKTRLQRINYVGIAVPVLVGSLVLSFGQFGLLSVVIAISSIIGLFQVTFNLGLSSAIGLKSIHMQLVLLQPTTRCQ